MLIKILVENATITEQFGAEHGLSLHIEACGHKVLFDMGRGELFLDNAQKLGVDIAGVDIAVLSHGHSDHGGGIAPFLRINSFAPVYMRPEAMQQHYTRRPDGALVDIGLDSQLLSTGRIVFSQAHHEIMPGLELFSGVSGRALFSQANKSLFMQQGDTIVEDSFEHEQNLIITEGNTMALFAGCAHNGIVNILARFEELKRRLPDYVFGGFHLYNPTSKKSEDAVLVLNIAEYLNGTPCIYYTGHCTGEEAYCLHQQVIGDRMRYMATGSVIKI